MPTDCSDRHAISLVRALKFNDSRVETGCVTSAMRLVLVAEVKYKTNMTSRHILDRSKDQDAAYSCSSRAGTRFWKMSSSSSVGNIVLVGEVCVRCRFRGCEYAMVDPSASSAMRV